MMCIFPKQIRSLIIDFFNEPILFPSALTAANSWLITVSKKMSLKIKIKNIYKF